MGIGVNTNNVLAKGLDALSLGKVLKKKIDNTLLLGNVLRYVSYYYSLLKQKKYSLIRKEWKEYSIIGSNVLVKTLQGTYSGVAHDINTDGFLIVKNKKKIVIREGDIFIKIN